MKIIAALIAFFSAAIMPLQNTLIALICFVIADLVTGVWKGIKEKKFSSRKFAQSIGKCILYFIGVFVFRIADLYFDLPKVCNLVVGLIVITEVISIAENIEALTGLKIADTIKTLLRREKK